MAKFTDEHRKEREFNEDYFQFGVHKVQIIGIIADETEGGKEFVEVAFVDPNNEAIEDKARVWFTTDAAIGYSLSILKSIFVHNAPEDKKDLARETVNSVEDHIKLVDLLVSKLIGKEMWFTKYQSPDRTYVDARGVTRKSVDKNIYGYEPKVKEHLIPKKENVASTAAEVFDADEEPFPSGPAKKPAAKAADSGWA